MKSGVKVACLVISLALGATAQAVTDAAGLPYQEIVTRNVFGLKPPPPPPSPEETKPPPSKITLTGITTIMGKLALMKTPAPPAKPGEPAKGERFYTLHVGERDGDIEVVAIDEKAGSVTVLNAGQQEILTFEKNGVKLAATPLPATPGVPGALPGVPRPPTGIVPPPIATPGTAAANPGMPTFPTRTIRSATPLPGGAPVNPSFGNVNPGFGTVAPSYSAPATQQPQVQLSPEETTILIEAQRERLRSKGNPNAMILPPTVLSPQNPVPGGAPNPMPQ